MQETKVFQTLRGRKPVWLIKVDEYILSNMSNPKLTISQIAGAVFVSERHFYRMVKKYTGKTPTQYRKSSTI